ncbi:MAG: hypothetical protein AAGE80_07155 [Pseudomonadota bacterium]
MPPFPSMKAPPPKPIHPTCLLMSCGASGAIVLFVWAVGGFGSFAVFLLFVLWMIISFWFYESCASKPDESDLLAIHRTITIGDQSGESQRAIEEQKVAGALPPPNAEEVAEHSKIEVPEPAADTPSEEAEVQPAKLASARESGPDDLTRIKGVGPKLEKFLNEEMGVYHFDQIANWSAAELRWVDENLGSFRGRASRDNWIDQAKALTG